MATYSLELKLNTKKASDCRYLENYFREVAKISNTVRRFAMRRIERLKRDKKYRELLTQYIKLDKGEEKDAVSKKLSAVVWSYGLTKFHLQKDCTRSAKEPAVCPLHSLSKRSVTMYGGESRKFCMQTGNGCISRNGMTF